MANAVNSARGTPDAEEQRPNPGVLWLGIAGEESKGQEQQGGRCTSLRRSERPMITPRKIIRSGSQRSALSHSRMAATGQEKDERIEDDHGETKLD